MKGTESSVMGPRGQPLRAGACFGSVTQKEIAGGRGNQDQCAQGAQEIIHPRETLVHHPLNCQFLACRVDGLIAMYIYCPSLQVAVDLQVG